MEPLNNDVIENILLQSAWQDVELLCTTNKTIQHVCNNKRLINTLTKQHQLQLFVDYNKINTMAQLIREYKKYQFYEGKVQRIIQYTKDYNVSLFIDLNVDDFLKEDIFNFVTGIFDYGKEVFTDPIEIIDYLIEINIDLVHAAIVFVFKNGNNVRVKPAQPKKGLLTLLTKFLYFYPEVDLKINSNYGYQKIQGTNVWILNKYGTEPTVQSAMAIPRATYKAHMHMPVGF